MIPSFIKSISSYALNRCKNLEKIEFEENSNLKYIGSYSFAYSVINYISLPQSLKNISTGLFYHCKNLKKVEFGINSQLSEISQDAFMGTNIKTLIIPKGFNQSYFSFPKNLQSIEFLSDNIQFVNTELNTFNSSLLIIAFPNANSVEINDSLWYKSNYFVSIIIPSNVKITVHKEKSLNNKFYY